MVFTVISVFFSKTCETEVCFESFLREFQCFNQNVSLRVWFRMVFTLISVFQPRRVTQCFV